MRKFIWVVFVVVLIIVAFFTFRPQPPFPSNGTTYLTGLLGSFLGK